MTYDRCLSIAPFLFVRFLIWLSNVADVEQVLSSRSRLRLGSGWVTEGGKICYILYNYILYNCSLFVPIPSFL